MESDPILDEDVVKLVERISAERGVPFRRALNDLVRKGLGYVPQQKKVGEPFRTKPLPLGKQLVDNIDNISEVLAIAEGENYR